MIAGRMKHSVGDYFDMVWTKLFQLNFLNILVAIIFNNSNRTPVHNEYTLYIISYKM